MQTLSTATNTSHSLSVTRLLGTTTWLVQPVEASGHHTHKMQYATMIKWLHKIARLVDVAVFSIIHVGSHTETKQMCDMECGMLGMLQDMLSGTWGRYRTIKQGRQNQPVCISASMYGETHVCMYAGQHYTSTNHCKHVC